jgi:hypothetical protein
MVRSPRRGFGNALDGCARAAVCPVPAVFACLLRAFFFLLNGQLLRMILETRWSASQQRRSIEIRPRHANRQATMRHHFMCGRYLCRR